MFQKSGIVSALNNVKRNLNENLNKKYGISNDLISESFLKTHGLSKDNFDFINNMENIISNNLNDVSIDDNANKNEKTIAGLSYEVTNPVNKLVGYRYLYRKMIDMYGKSVAKELTGDLYDYSLMLHDSSKILVPYCWALDASKIVTNGRDFGVLRSSKPKSLSSYISALNESIHQLSNHLAGAMAIGTFFIDSAHILLYRENKTLDEIKKNKKTRKYIENCYQNFIHSVNHLSRMASESPFTNVSFFDKTKLKSLLSSNNMGWYFNDSLNIKDNKDKDKYIISTILELQEIFSDFFEKGDPLQGGMPYRFPVATFNISKKINKNKEINLTDKNFVSKISKYDISKFNILVSEGSKVSSCCRLLSNAEMLGLGNQVNSFGGGGLSLGSHRVVTINFNRIALEAKSYNEYKNILNNRIDKSAKILKAHKELIIDLEKKGLQPFISNGWINMRNMFSTLGILGIVEAQNTLKNKFKIKEDIIEESLRQLNIKSIELGKKYGIIINQEQVPGESGAVRLAFVDQLIFGKNKVPYSLYANQFIPLWEDASIWDRMDKDGRYNLLMTGGGIVHFNLGSKTTSIQTSKLINYAIKSGCEHFALNGVYCRCKKGHTHFGDHSVCPECGSDVVDKLTRVVGFFTPVSSWNPTRKEKDFPNRKFKNIE